MTRRPGTRSGPPRPRIPALFQQGYTRSTGRTSNLLEYSPQEVSAANFPQRTPLDAWDLSPVVTTPYTVPSPRTPELNLLPYTLLSSAEVQRMIKRSRRTSGAARRLFSWAKTPPQAPRPFPAHELQRTPWAPAPVAADSTADSPKGASTQGSMEAWRCRVQQEHRHPPLSCCTYASVSQPSFRKHVDRVQEQQNSWFGRLAVGLRC